MSNEEERLKNISLGVHGPQVKNPSPRGPPSSPLPLCLTIVIPCIPLIASFQAFFSGGLNIMSLLPSAIPLPLHSLLATSCILYNTSFQSFYSRRRNIISPNSPFISFALAFFLRNHLQPPEYLLRSLLQCTPQYHSSYFLLYPLYPCFHPLAATSPPIMKPSGILAFIISSYSFYISFTFISMPRNPLHPPHRLL